MITMTANAMKAAGFRVSAQVSDAEVERAMSEALKCYVKPLTGMTDSEISDLSDTDTAIVNAAMQVAYVLLLRRRAVATRAGGKDKLTPTQSENAYPSQSDVDDADSLLRQVQTVDGIPSKMVDDIAGIYYRNTFIGL